MIVAIFSAIQLFFFYLVSVFDKCYCNFLFIFGWYPDLLFILEYLDSSIILKSLLFIRHNIIW